MRVSFEDQEPLAHGEGHCPFHALAIGEGKAGRVAEVCMGEAGNVCLGGEARE